MIQWQDQNSRIGDRKRALDQIHIFARARKLGHVDGKVRIGHHTRQRVHHEVGIAPAGKIKREMVLRVIERAKKRNTLDMIEMEMAEKNVSADRLVAELLLEFISEVTNSGSTIEDQNLIGVGPDLNARGISAIPHVFLLWCWSGAANSPKPHAHLPRSHEL